MKINWIWIAFKIIFVLSSGTLWLYVLADTFKEKDVTGWSIAYGLLVLIWILNFGYKSISNELKWEKYEDLRNNDGE